jgi:peptidoglycan-associated lipoprotein
MKVKQSTKQFVLMIAVLSAALVIAGCRKKEVPPPPPPPPPPAPTASLSANPDSIEQGQSTTLTWQTSNATDVSIDNGVGAVQPNGSQQVSPGESTTYTLTAKGPGGSQSATARVTVTAKPAPPPPVAGPTDEELFNQNVKDIFFDYDKYNIRADQESPLQGDVAFFKEHPGVKFVIEGHCDERGSTEYNLTLGDNRANSAKNALIQAGVSPSQIVNVISYGKEKPFCTEHTEECWQLNRRAHLVYQK